MISLARNTRLVGRGRICAGVLAVLIRISCFPSHTGPIHPFKSGPASDGTSKKKGKKAKEISDSSNAANNLEDLNDGFLETIMEFVTLVENGAPFPDGFVNTSVQKLLVFLADFGNVTVSQIESPAKGQSAAVHEEKLQENGFTHDKKDLHEITFFDIAVAVFNQMLVSNMVPRREFVEDEDDGLCSVQNSVQRILNLRAAIKQAFGGQEKNLKLKIADSLYSVLVHALFQTITFDDIGVFLSCY